MSQTVSPARISIVLAALAALAPFAIDTYLPAFKVLAASFEASNVEIQQSLTAYLLPYAIMTLFHGAISDAIGRLKTIYWGLGIFALASIGCALATNVETLCFFRVLQGISAGAGNVVARAMVRDLFEGVTAQRVMAQLQMLFAIAPAIAPIIGGWLLGIHWQAIFWFLCLYAVVVLFAASRLLPETVTVEKRLPLSLTQLITGYRQAFGDRNYRWLVTAFGATFSGFFIYVLSAPVFLMEHLHLASHQFWVMFIPTVCGTTLGSWLAKRAAGRLKPPQILRIGFAWMGASAVLNMLVCAAHLSPIGLYIAPIALYNIGMAFVLPVLSIAALDCLPRMRGTASSGQAFVQMVLSSLSAGMLIPLIWHHPLWLAGGMVLYWSFGLIAVSRTGLWQSADKQGR